MLDIEHGYLVGRNGAGNQTGSECRKHTECVQGPGTVFLVIDTCKGIGWEGEQRLKKKWPFTSKGLISISFITILINLMILEL